MQVIFCPLFSGSSGNSAFISCDDTHLLIDAGRSGKDIINALKSIDFDAADLSGILVTHEHSDHILGVGVLSRKLGIPVYASAPTWNAMAGKLGSIPPENMRIFIPGRDFFIGSFALTPFSVSHDAADPVGFSFCCGNKKLSTLTDTGIVANAVLDVIKDSNVILLESNHDIDMLKFGQYPEYLKRRILGKKGHLSNSDAGKVLAKLVDLNVNYALLGHLSENNNTAKLAIDTVCDALTQKGVKLGTDITVTLAGRECVSDYLVLK